MANEYSFALLTSAGEVYSWGDPRYSLGREVSTSSSASEPHLVSRLEGLRMYKVASGGWLTAVLSEEGDVYLWGSQPGGGGEGKIEFLPGEPDNVGLVDLGVDVNVVDVAVGGGHVSVLTEGGSVYTVGKNENGQTAAEASANFQATWKSWEKCWDGKARRVHCGSFSWCTLVLVQQFVGDD